MAALEALAEQDGPSWGVCTNGVAHDQRGVQYQCSGVDLLARVPLEEYYPANISSVGATYREYFDYSEPLCRECSGSKKKNDKVDLNAGCRDAIAWLKSGPCYEDRINDGTSPPLCLQCLTELYGGQDPNAPKITQMCMLGFNEFCDNEIGQSDMWGWSDEVNGREYILSGLRHGVAILDITSRENPQVVAKIIQPKALLPRGFVGGTPFCPASWWKDIKVLRNRYMLVSSEAAYFGVRVYDLHQLRLHNSTARGHLLMEEIANYDAVSSTHNLVIGPRDYVYAVGSNTCKGGLHIIDFIDPKRPKTAGCYEDDGYIHDCQCEIYHGQDARYFGHEICFCGCLGCSFPGGGSPGGFAILDVSDKKSVRRLSCTSYPHKFYPHQGWLSYDHAYFFFGDETDEENAGVRTRTLVWELGENLEAPSLAAKWANPLTTAVDHNMFYYRGALFQSNYEAGLRVLKFNSHSNRASDTLQEIAFFDTFPPPSKTTTNNGTWGLWPFFRNGTIGICAERMGCYILRMQDSVMSQLTETPAEYHFPGRAEDDANRGPDRYSSHVWRTIFIVTGLFAVMILTGFLFWLKTARRRLSGGPNIEYDGSESEDNFELSEYKGNDSDDDLSFEDNEDTMEETID
mmetsp:Transcript_2801/g.4302  ORF Transcript_2801/g.4302 Transcript_2801/m.4302 type:complete len:630 (-) Transcript_2801:256-2145(-)